MFGIGFSELILILVVALVIFGPDKMPELGKTMGKAVREFKSAVNKIDAQVRSEVDEVKDAAGMDETLKDLGQELKDADQRLKETDARLKDFDRDMCKFDKDLKDISKINPLKMEAAPSAATEETEAEQQDASAVQETTEFTATDVKAVKVELK